MKLQFILLLFMFCAVSTSAWQNNVRRQAELLKELYEDARSHPGDKVAASNFFNAFPNSFRSFSDLYGYDVDRPSILYAQAYDHLDIFFSSARHINDTTPFRKMIRIALNGRWEADGVSYFQSGIRDFIRDQNGLVIYLMKSLNSHDQHSFWVFYFDGPHPATEIDLNLKAIELASPEVYRVLLEAHRYVVKDWKDH